MIEIRRQATTAHSFGLEMHLLTPKEALAAKSKAHAVKRNPKVSL